MDMLFDGMFVQRELEDGSFLWANPASACYFWASSMCRSR